jgi:hypothetical protein
VDWLKAENEREFQRKLALIEGGEPIASLARGDCPRVGKRCGICRQKLTKGEPAVWFTFFTEPADFVDYLHGACFDSSALKANYEARLMTRSYRLDAFRRQRFANADVQQLLAEGDLAALLDRVVWPRTPKLLTLYGDQPAADRNELSGLATPLPGAKTEPRLPMQLLSILLHCGYAQAIAQRMPGFAEHAWIDYCPSRNVDARGLTNRVRVSVVSGVGVSAWAGVRPQGTPLARSRLAGR